MRRLNLVHEQPDGDWDVQPFIEVELDGFGCTWFYLKDEFKYQNAIWRITEVKEINNDLTEYYAHMVKDLDKEDVFNETNDSTKKEEV